MADSVDEFSESIYDSVGVGRLDSLTIAGGVDAYTLMCRAGHFAYAILRRCYPRARRIAVICGPGNNGGDGYVLARLADADGLDVSIGQTADPARPTAQRAARDCNVQRARGIGVLDGEFDVLVDAILGVGLNAAPRPIAAEFIRAINAYRHFRGASVLAIDVPSGLNASNGNTAGACVRADDTCTFIGSKLGLLTGRGPAQCGRIHFDDCSVDASVRQRVRPRAWRLGPRRSMTADIERSADTHKGRAGRALVVGGNSGYLGAVRLSAEAALRTGTGLVTVATHPTHYPAVVHGCYELIARGVDDGDDLVKLMGEQRALAVGPGLGRDRWAHEMLRAALGFDGPKVIDADGLNLLAERPRRISNAVLTPHPAEAARLLGIDTSAVEQDRPAATYALQEKFGATVVLKGAGTLVLTERGRLFVCDRGHSGMASAGMGDVLTGIIVGLIAQGARVDDAACLGVWLHACAAEDAGTDGRIGIVASDLMHGIRRRRSALAG